MAVTLVIITGFRHMVPFRISTGLRFMVSLHLTIGLVFMAPFVLNITLVFMMPFSSDKLDAARQIKYLHPVVDLPEAVHPCMLELKLPVHNKRFGARQGIDLGWQRLPDMVISSRGKHYIDCEIIAGNGLNKPGERRYGDRDGSLITGPAGAVPAGGESECQDHESQQWYLLHDFEFPLHKFNIMATQGKHEP